jgi:putative nucleotidyltransferase with HDIG domain
MGMRRPALLSDQLDRVAYSTFFLGAVVPLLALAVTLERFVLPGITDRNTAIAWIVAGVSIGVLSLGSFFALRHMTRQVVAHMRRDNLRLSALLRVSGELADAQHLAQATETVARCALELSGAEGAFVFAASDSNVATALAAISGDRAVKLYEQHREALDEVARLVLDTGRPVVRGGAPDAAGLAVLAVPIPGSSAPAGALVVAAAGASAEGLAESDALSTLAGLAAVSIHNADLRDSQRNFFSHMTDILVQALDAHLQFHVGHSQRVAELANRVGRALTLPDPELHRLHFAALLHDIGMLKLDRNQQMNSRTCDKHALIGARMLARIRLWKELAPIVQHHHEWWDGHGYPDGLAGEAIPREARIIAVCDAFDTMTSEQSYKGSMSVEDALAELDAFAGTQFDPALVHVLHDVCAQDDSSGS